MAAIQRAGPTVVYAQTRCDGPDVALPCHFEGMPAQLSATATLAGPREPGERMQISGRLSRPDGSPAAGVILYLYQTDATGRYTRTDSRRGRLRQHGHLYGWLRTGADGRYEISTIRPAPYPNGSIPAHIHPVVRDPRHGDYYMTDFVFADDRLVTADYRRSIQRWGFVGGDGVVTLTRSGDGVWRGTRDVVLK